MNHRATFKQNKPRLDMRTQTKNLLSRFRKKHSLKLNEIKAGKIYGITYQNDEFITDKHHRVAIVGSFGLLRENGRIAIKGVNLLYLNPESQLKIMDSLKHDLSIIGLVEREVPYVIKNFVANKILSIFEIEEKKWGLIPLLKVNLFGVQPFKLKSDHLLEKAVPPVKTNQPAKSLIEEDANEVGGKQTEELTIEEVGEYLESDEDDI